MNLTEIFKNNFHDSNIVKVSQLKSNLKIIIDIDTYWNPGKKYGILKLLNCKYDMDFLKTWENDVDGWIDSLECYHNRGKYICKIRFHARKKTWKFVSDSLIF